MANYVLFFTFSSCIFQLPDGIQRFANINISQASVATHLM